MLIWKYVLGITLHWMVLPMSVIILLAVGSDYNLLLVSRMKEEIAAGLNGSSRVRVAELRWGLGG